jgi:hypothetical protein
MNASQSELHEQETDLASSMTRLDRLWRSGERRVIDHGDPELPPMMSFVVTKSSGVGKSRLSRDAMTRGVSANGDLSSKLADRSNSPKNVGL